MMGPSCHRANAANPAAPASLTQCHVDRSGDGGYHRAKNVAIVNTVSPWDIDGSAMM